MNNNQRSIKRTLSIVLVIACILHEVTSFVVQPQRTTVAVRRVKTEVTSTLQPYDPRQEQEPTSFLGKAANKITSILPFKMRPKDELTLRGEQERRLQQKEMSRGMKEALRPFPWPIRAPVSAITNTVTRTFGKEARKAEPLLADARRLIEADSDARDFLGDHIITGRILSQSTSTVMVNFVKSKRIKTSFEVLGSKNRGVAHMIADKYAKGHIAALQLRVNGMTYDIL